MRVMILDNRGRRPRTLALAGCGLVIFLGGKLARAETKVDGPAKPVATAADATKLAGDKIQFNRDIRPILAEHCLQCHGPDSASRKGDLRFDRREAAIEREAIVPGKPEKSELVARIVTDDPEEIMPPPSTHKTLSVRDKQLLKDWIAAGAVYEPHWSFIAPVRGTVPVVKNKAWVRNPIDAFILAKLEEQRLTPAPEADRRTLARRLSLDLTGLPPEPAEVEAFVADKSSDAYEKLVDRLMAKPTWGEHRGRYWLDAARYGDTHGIHIDNAREMWAYREWVINAFNRNLPFDTFTTEQLAGDLLPNRTLDQQIASGFNRCNITTSEGGAIAEEYLVLYDRDRTETTSAVWLGLTANCAVCHDHKFDPLTQREFYEMGAFFNNTTQAAMDGNVKDTPPVVVVPQPSDRAEWAALTKQSTDLEQQLDARRKAARPEYETWATTATPGPVLATVPHEGLRLHALLGDVGRDRVSLVVDNQLREAAAGKVLTGEPGRVAAQAMRTAPGVAIEVPEAGDFDAKQPFSCALWVKLPKLGPSGAVIARMGNKAYQGWDFMIEPSGRLTTHIVHKWPDDAIKVAVKKKPIPVNIWTHLVMTYDGSGKAAGVTFFVDGERMDMVTQIDKLGAGHTIRTDAPLTIGSRGYGNSKIDGVALQDVRVYGRKLAHHEVRQIGERTRAAWLASKPLKERTADEKNELYQWYLPALDKKFGETTSQLAGVQAKQATIKQRGSITHVMQEKPEMPVAYVLYRGEYDKRRDEVKPNTPGMLPPMPSDLPRNRIGFAQWLLRPEHPLTARVTVNRFWQEVFGTGIVRTTGDLGASGELPSHPELLDWLAIEFRESGWDVKRLFKLLVTSATYRQSAVATKEKLEKDPHNRLLARGPRFRMDAEMVRDYALAASGLLVEKLGGPSVRPYQPEGVWEAVAMTGSNTRFYVPEKGEGLYRRSMYTFWKRAAPPASMDIFNAPSREVCTVRRERTNTPLQALVTLNDPQFIEAARHLAERALSEGGREVGPRLEFLARRVLARPLSDAEQAVVRSGLESLAKFYQAHPDDAGKLITVGDSKPNATLEPRELAAWTMVANELMNLDEVLNK